MNANDAQLVQSVKGYLKLNLDSLNEICSMLFLDLIEV